ncbi:MAG TPA: class I SAM-dependent methyltransferase [Allosphingosinicella sp.]|nr:class I SAM-dependent methyltransferase [Allosphingosinicella sp.]
MTSYRFERVDRCNMCGASPEAFRLLGLRMNRSQGLRPKAADGIAVSVKKCRACALVFADPQPIPARIEDHYGIPPEDYWTEAQFRIEDGYFATETAAAKRLLQGRPAPEALDIGAGLGKVMVVLGRAGFDVSGIEPSAPFRDRAIQAHGIDPGRLLHATIEEAEFPAGKFDFITFGAVLEHLYDPAAAIEKCLKWLKPGGVVHAEVPSSAHLISRLINRYYRLRGTNFVTNLSPMHVPFHLYEFGLSSFEKHGGRAGYEIADRRFSVCTIYHFPAITHKPLHWWMERRRSGMQLTVYLRKSGAA